MSHSNKPCPTCGRPVHPLAPAGICPHCLLEATAGNDIGDTGTGSNPGDLPEIPRFQISGEIGEGAFGIVYRARQTEPVSRPAAVKVMKSRASGGPGSVRFEAERQALARMQHPGIATFYDAGKTAGGRPFFAMELVDGAALNEFVESAKLGMRDKLQLFLKLCEAVAHAHQKGIIHRDLKPSNILVGADGEPRVIDFGIAKATEELLTEQTLLTRDGQMMGTPQYMSPEQAAGGIGVDTRADVYSLGAVLYELVAGHPPFSGGEEMPAASLESLLRSIREQVPAPPSGRGLDIDAICLRALEKDPARRYGTVAALGADVERYLGGEPVDAKPPGKFYLLRKFVERHRLPVGAAAVALLAVVGGGFASALLAVKAAKASRAADTAEIDTRRTFADSDAGLAAELVARDPSAAAAYLCRALRNDPDHKTAGVQLLRLLADHTFPRCVAEVQMPAGDSIYSLHPVPGGKRLVATGDQGSYLLDASDLSKPPTNLRGPQGLNNYTYSDISHDGSAVVVGYQDARSRVWSTSDGRPLSQILNSGGTGGDSPVAFGPDPQRFYAAGGAGFIAAYDLDGKGGATRVWRRWLWRGLKQKVVARIAPSPDGTAIAVGGDEGDVHWLRSDDGETIAETVIADGGNVRALAYVGPDRLVAGTNKGLLSVWDTSDQSEVTALHAHGRRVRMIVASPDGARFATTSDDRTARVWSSSDGRPITPPLSHDGACWCAAFNADGTLLATGDRNRFVRVWDTNTGLPATAPIPDETGITAVAFEETGQLLAGGQDGRIRRWNLSDRRATAVPVGKGQPLRWPVFPAPGRIAAWEPVMTNGTVIARQWSVTDGKEGAAAPMPGGVSWRWSSSLNKSFIAAWQPGAAPALQQSFDQLGEAFDDLKSIAITPDGSRMFALYKNKPGAFFDLETGQRLSELGRTLSPGMPVEISADGSFGVMVATDGCGYFIDSATGKPIGQPMEFGKRGVRWIAFSPDQSRVALSGPEGVKLFSVPDGQALSDRFSHHDGAFPGGYLIKFSPDGETLATTMARDGSVRIWSGRDGIPLGSHYVGEAVSGLVFSTDGSLLYASFTARGRGEVRIIEVATGRLLSVRGQSLPADSLALDENDSTLFVTGNGGGILHREAPSGRLPDWFLAAAESHVGQRLNADGNLKVIPSENRAAPLAEALRRSGEIGDWADWLFAEPSPGRTAAPGLERPTGEIEQATEADDPPPAWKQLLDRLDG